MSDDSDDRTASLMTPAKLAQLKTRPRPAATPAAWLDQLAADAGSGHVRALLDLRKLLEDQVRARGSDAVLVALAALAQALQQLDCTLLRPRGWLARATGRGKEQAVGFAAQADHVGRAGEEFTDALRVAQRKPQGHAAAERALLELDVELRGIEKIMDQGARWLQDMRNQLKTRQAQGADAAVAQQIREDSARCELLLARLKLLRAASSPAQQAAQHIRAALPGRAAVLQSLQSLAEGEWRAWQR
ncbi:MAG TPA: hypothetical protein VFE74_03795, partial [Ramlibacter sp.]|nr:hypothetical protein [Ramlibacter sp.]